MAKQGLALFDFDGTLVRGDSFRYFIRYMVGMPAMLRGAIALSPWLAGYVTGWTSNHRAKEKVTDWFFKNIKKEDFNAKSAQFAEEVLYSQEIPEAMQLIYKHQKNGDRIIIVSASFENYLLPWAKRHSLEVIGTRLEVIEGCITGRFATPNCHGAEKVRRILEMLNPEDYQPIFAYGDTKGDLPMLAMADESFYKHF